MQRIICKSKLHGLRVTGKNLAYEGSLTIDEELLVASDILPNEMVHVINVNSGVRFETYIIKGERGSGTVCLNGGAARLGEIGDELIVMSSALMDTVDARSYTTKKIVVDAQNRVKEQK
jgi:aspartate 1-decarboxylase